MFKFLLGAIFGAGCMYYGSEQVADNCVKAMWATEQTLKNEQAITQKAIEQIANWTYDGTVDQKIAQIRSGNMYFDGNQFVSK